MKRSIKVAMTITLMFMVISTANAQQGQRNGHGQGQGSGRGYGQHQSLNLTADQQTQFKSMRLKMQQDMLPIRNKIGENRAKLRTLTTVENADLKAINKVIDSNSQLTASMAKLQATNHQAVRSLLTEEQRIIYDTRDFSRGDRKTQGQKAERGERGQRRTKRHGQGQGQGNGQQGKE
jgi:Spy/CpxP family protein refolding chaperone